MSGETDLETLLRSMKPHLAGTAYTFAMAAACEVPPGVSILGSFVEDEGLSIVAPLAEIERAGLAHAGSWAKISLTIHSSLSAVGLTASVASALAEHGISANMIAAYYHDHIFVPWDKRHEAMSILNGIGSREG
jgi:hypothetical protein